MAGVRSTRWILLGITAIFSVFEATDFVQGESLQFIDTNFLYSNENLNTRQCHTVSGYTLCSQHVSLLHHRKKRAEPNPPNNSTSSPSLPPVSASAPATPKVTPAVDTVKNGSTTPPAPSTTPNGHSQNTKTPAVSSTPTTTVKQTPPVPPTLSPWNFTVIEDKDHTYYTSQHFAAEKALPYMIDIYKVPGGKVKTHTVLSQAHRTAGSVKLSFKFSFYGHEIDQVTIATGGFIYMSKFLHQWLTATQYIAPLMANFDTRIGGSSHIRYVDNGTVFVVQWDQVHLQDLTIAGSFTFQAALFKSGKIVFSYKKIPYAIQNIPVGQHPVKVGVSDAFYNDTDHYLPQGKFRTRKIQEYHRIEIQGHLIVSGSVVVLNPVPKRRTRLIREYHRVSLTFNYIVSGAVYVLNPVETCVMQKDCNTCLTKNLSFTCSWCAALGHCSDGMDRKRQLWFQKGCSNQGVKVASNCNRTTVAPPTQKLLTTPSNPPSPPDASTVGRTTKSVKLTTKRIPSTTRPLLTSKKSVITSTVRPVTTKKPATKPATKPSTTSKLHPSTTSKLRSTVVITTPSKKVPTPTTNLKPRTTKSLHHPITTTGRNIVQPAPQTNGCETGDNNNKTCPDANSTKQPPVGNTNTRPSNAHNMIGIVIGLFILALVICIVVGWVWYAYRNPTSRSGMWLMEHRPSQLKMKMKFWKRGDAGSEKYQVSVEPSGNESVA